MTLFKVLFSLLYLFTACLPAYAEYLPTRFPSETEFHTEDINITKFTSSDRNFSYSDQNVPVAVHNTKLNEYLVVWNEYKGVDDPVKVVYAKRVNGQTGQPIGEIVRVSDEIGYQGANDSEDPIAHYDSVKDRYFIVWINKYERSRTGYDRREVRAQYLDGSTLAKLSPNSISIGGETFQNKFSLGYIVKPDMAFNSQSGEYLVIWTALAYVGNPVAAKKEIFGQRVLDLTQPGADDFRLTYFTEQGKRYVHDAKIRYSPISNRYLLIFQGEIYFDFPNPTTGIRHGHNLYTLPVSATGAPGTTPIVVSPEGEFMTNLEMAYNPARNEFFTVWKTHPGTDNTTGAALRAQRLTIGGTTIGAYIDQLNDLPFNIARHNQAVEYWADRGQYIVVWAGYENHKTAYVYGQLIDAETAERKGVNSFRISQRMHGYYGGYASIGRPALAVNNTPGANLLFTAWLEPDKLFPDSNADIIGMIYRPYATNVTLPQFNLDVETIKETPTPGPNETPAPISGYDLSAKIEKIPSSIENYRISCTNSGQSIADKVVLKVYASKNKKLETGSDPLIRKKNLTLKKPFLKLKASGNMKFLIAECDAVNAYQEANESNNRMTMIRSKK